MDIVKFPPLLIIHLSRFYQFSMSTMKKHNFVSFDNSDYTVQGFNNQHTMFNLYAVSNHFGTLAGGHYTAFCDVLQEVV